MTCSSRSASRVSSSVARNDATRWCGSLRMNPTVSVSSTCAFSPRSTSRVSGSSVAKSRSSTKTSGAPDQRAQDRRLAGVRVADERRLELACARLALHRAAAAARRASRSLQQLDAVVDQPAVGLELRFTRAAHADAAAEFLEVGPHAREPRQHVLELRELHLHLRLAPTARASRRCRGSARRGPSRACRSRPRCSCPASATARRRR